MTTYPYARGTPTSSLYAVTVPCAHCERPTHHQVPTSAWRRWLAGSPGRTAFAVMPDDQRDRFFAQLCPACYRTHREHQP